MGQTLGRAPMPKCTRFVNLPKRCVYELWSAYNDIAEGFGLTMEEFSEIVKSSCMEYLSVTERILAPDIDALFRLLDDDENRLVDALEFMAALAMLSGMTPEEKIRFIFAMFDFDESGVLTLDEMVLAYRSCLGGACKVCKIDPPTEGEIEVTVGLGFDMMRKTNTSSNKAQLQVFQGIDREGFIHYSLNTPDIMCWIEFFDDLNEYAARNTAKTMIAGNVAPKLSPAIPQFLLRDDQDEAFMNAMQGGPLKLSVEEENSKAAPHRNWKNVVNFLSASVNPLQKSLKAPKNMEIDWIYGYNGHSANQQTLFYGIKGEVIYAAGAVVIVQSVAKHEQQYFLQHHDLVSCIAGFHVDAPVRDIPGAGGESKMEVVVTAAGRGGNTIIASGELGVRPTIFIWEVNGGTIVSTIYGFHRGGIEKMDFSPNRDFLVTLGKDPYHSLAIYAWRNSMKVWSARTTCNIVHDVKFLNDRVVGCCGVNHVYFWISNVPPPTGAKATVPAPSDGLPMDSSVLNKLTFKRYRGQGTSQKPEDHIFRCMGSVAGNIVYSGTETGYIQVWEGRNWVRQIKAHIGAVNATAPIGNKGMVTGCNSGKILVWNDNLEITASFGVNTLGPISLDVRALAYEQLSSKILVGLKSGEVFEMDATDGRNVHAGGALISAHAHHRVCGLACHPYQANIVCTVGDDKTIRIYDVELKKQVRMCTMESVPHSVRYTQDGQALIVGIGTGVKGEFDPKEGCHILINAEDLTILHEARDTKFCINDIRFSPDGELIAMAGYDGTIYMYHRKKMDAYAICRGHTGQVIHIDFSTTGSYLMSNSSEGELLFWDTATGQQLPPKQMKTVKWETNSCTFSFATQSFPLNDNKDQGVKYNKVCKTNADDCLFFVDNYGILTLASYPCYYEEKVLPDLTYYYGHAKGSTNVVISCDDHKLFTVGEHDGCLISWKVHLSDPVAANDDLKRVETVPPTLVTEIGYDGKAIDRLKSYEDAINHNVFAISEIEEGLRGMKNMMSWQKTIISPSRNLPDDPSEPPDHLSIEYVYGLTHDITRRSLFYATNSLKNSRGEFVFILGNFAVVMHPVTRQQRYYRHHYSKVTAMAINKEYELIASGDQGRLPKIHIWEYETLTPRCVLQGFHRKGIAHLKFSANGRYLLSVGQDAFHSLAIYDWQKEEILTTTPTFVAKCFDVDFNPNATQVVQIGNEIIRFWTFYGKNAHYQDGILSNRAKMQGFLCLGWIGGSAVVGTVDGNLYRFLGNRLESIVQAHNACVNCLVSSPDGLVSCGADGMLKIWTRFLECRLVVETRSLRTISPVIKTCDWDYDSGRILLGTAAAEIFEISAADGENRHKACLLEGHGGDELWGLSVNPTKEEFVTVGDDCLLRVWNLEKHVCTQTVALEMPARCVAFSPDGKHIAVGMGSPRKIMERQFDGKWIIIDTIDFQISHEARDSTKWLRDILYSPNGQYIAIGSEDWKVYVYNVNEGYACCAVITQHQSFIVSLDFSDDSAWLRVNCGGYELCYFESETGLYIPSAARLRDVTWASQHCPMEFTSQGIWPMQYDGTDYLAMDCNTFRGDFDGQIICAGDTFGRLKMFRFPCLNSSAAMSKSYWVSSSPITRVRFASGDAYLLTISGFDKSIIQWKHNRDREEGVAYQTGDRRQNAGEDDDDEDVAHRLALYQYNVNLEEEVEEELKALISTRPWIGAVVEPSSVAEHLLSNAYIYGEIPSQLVLSHVFGNQCQLSRNHVFYNCCQEVLLPTSRYVAIYNKKDNRQSGYYRGHGLRKDPVKGSLTDSDIKDINVLPPGGGEVCCLTVSKDGKFCASVEKSARPAIHLWDAVTGSPIKQLTYVHRKGVLSLEFSLSNLYLVSLGADDDHSIALWTSPSRQWYDGTIVSWQRGDIAPVTFVTFYDVITRDFNFTFVSGGRNHIKFWQHEGNTINAVYAEYNKQVKLNTMLCGKMIPSNKKLLVGSLSGHLYVWKGRRLDRIIRAHERGITAIYVSTPLQNLTTAPAPVKVSGSTASGGLAAMGKTSSSTALVVPGGAASDATVSTMFCLVVTGSKEGQVKIWSAELEHLKTLNLVDADVPPLMTSIRSVDALLDLQGQLSTILVSTASAEVYEANVLSARINMLNEAHYNGELHGLATHPRNPDVFMTVGDDMTVRLWSISENRLLRKAVIDCTTRCCAWSPDGKTIIIGLGGKSDGSRQRKDGAFLILDGETLKPRYEGRDSRHHITEVKFTPDGKVFAVASMDHKIYLYTNESFKLRGLCDKHNSFIKAMDFSKDSIYITTDSKDYEHLYFEVADGQYFAVGSQLRDIKWVDGNSIYGWPVQGIWPTVNEDGDSTAPEPNCCHRSPNQKLLAVGDQGGNVKLFQYPCLNKKAAFLEYKAHIGPVAKLRFTSDNKYVISIGEKDRAICVWKVLNNEEDAPEIPRQQYTGQVSSRPGTSSGPSTALVANPRK